MWRYIKELKSFQGSQANGERTGCNPVELGSIPRRSSMWKGNPSFGLVDTVPKTASPKRASGFETPPFRQNFS